MGSFRYGMPLALSLFLLIASAYGQVPPDEAGLDHDFMVSWEAPTHSTDELPLPEDVELEYTIYAGRSGADYLPVYDSGITETHYGFLSPGTCFDIYVTATRMDVGAESLPSETVQWCPGDDPEVAIPPALGPSL